ncbi:MAG: T9SS type A sorting domain-containing protein [Aureispira sp.]|nr:T9SS type A sorting domain-containing protein [Aureispira sp.]
MPRFNLLVVLFFLWTNSNLEAQIVTIPDANFKVALVTDTAINTNGDTEIQVSEAIAYNGAIQLSYMGISDLTGIEAFTALTQLYCHYNQLTSLDVSANTALTHLYCEHNQLTSLNVSSNTALTRLDCYSNQLSSLNTTSNTILTHLYCNSNQLTSLDISTNTVLTNLECSSNQLTSLNVSNNIALTHFHCHSNQLTSLNVSNNTALIVLSCISNQLTNLDFSTNTALTYLFCYSNQLTSLNVKNGTNINFAAFDAKSNPNLTCIQVDDAAYSTTNWPNKDATATYSTTCLTNVESVANPSIELTAYPNPTQGAFAIQLDKPYSELAVKVYNTTGEEVFAQNYTAVQYLELDLGEAAAGMYMVKVQTAEGDAVLKILKD